MPREMGPASVDEMVLCFLQAEINSPCGREQYIKALQERGLDRSSLIDNADLNDAQANCDREVVLGAVRGFGRNVYLFGGFPRDTKWRRMLLEPGDFGQLRYLNYQYWVGLTDGTRSVCDLARHIGSCQDRKLAKRIAGIAEEVSKGAALPKCPSEDFLSPLNHLDSMEPILI
jgi:hypothetical protein